MNAILTFRDKDFKKVLSQSKVQAKESLLWWQKRGLMYTSTGYGRKIPTRYMVKYNNRWMRVYCCIYSNIGTCYIESNRQWIVVDINDNN